MPEAEPTRIDRYYVLATAEAFPGQAVDENGDNAGVCLRVELTGRWTDGEEQVIQVLLSPDDANELGVLLERAAVSVTAPPEPLPVLYDNAPEEPIVGGAHAYVPNDDRTECQVCHRGPEAHLAAL